ncbi:serine/threonine-protein kinase [Oculatella sp. LEGE 06141]|uniref:serine/threonine-protein kinase n=1 Tax=Oculatella sp. LEGE 06141 TaxID=1828648 RepID=UPI0030D6E1C2
MSDRLGTELKGSKYRLLGLVGQGQFGQVYCAVHRQTGRLVALKNLEHQRFPTHQFLRELRFLLSLQHPNIVNCQALEHTRTGRCLVMDYCEGGTLRQLMNEGVCLSVSQSLKLIADVLAGLEQAHSQGIVHCDIKPENILLTLQPHGWTAKISDFGIARLSQELANDETGNTGSPAYMAPERFYGQYSITSDLYSVGILLFELLTGRRPFSGTPAELMSAHLNCPVKLPQSIPDLWHPLIVTSLQKLSARRFRSAGEMLALLRAIAMTEGSGSWLDPQSAQLPLLRSAVTLPICPFHYQQQELLTAPVRQIVAVEEPQDESVPGSQINALDRPTADWYRAAGKQLQILRHTSQLCRDKSSQPVIVAPTLFGTGSFAEPLQTVFASPHGCFAATAKALYLVARTELQQVTPQFVTALAENSTVAIDPKGRWIAAVAPTSDSNKSALRFGRLSNPLTKVTWSSPILLRASTSTDHGLKLLALDSRHAAVISSIPVRGAASPAKASLGTLIEVFTRRGNRITAFTLPICLERVVLTPTLYRLLATDCNDPYSVLLVDLKPFRVARFAVEILPQFLYAATWGYVLADACGQMVFLDRQGQQLSRLNLPAPVTAIAPVYPHGLLVATWAENRGNLYTLNLKELEVNWLL